MVYVTTSAHDQKVKSPRVKIKGKTRNEIGRNRKGRRGGKPCGKEQSWPRNDKGSDVEVPEHEGEALEANPISSTA